MSCTIYVDGACTNNQNPNIARAGYGVYWPNQSHLNISERLSGRQTNQRAEIMAAVKGINQAAQLGYDQVTVKLDSQYVKGAAEEWIPRWERENWVRQVTNREDFLKLRDAMRRIDVRFVKVDREANQMADSLARAGARRAEVCEQVRYSVVF